MRRALFLLIASGCTAVCDPAEVQRRLDAAAPGEVVLLEGCTVTGELTVPAGVTLRGSGGARVVSGRGRAVTLEPGADGATALEDLTVESDGCAAVVAIGQGRVALRDVTVQASRGVGVAVSGATELALERVPATGPITDEAADSTAPPLPPFVCAAVATHGVVLVDVADATLTDVRADGFGAFGLLALRSSVAWRGGGAATNLGAGVEIFGGDAILEELAIERTRDGAGAIEAYGAVFGGGAVVSTRAITARDGDGFGLFHDGVMAVHEDATITGHGFAGVWAQGGGALELRGAPAVSDSTFAGVAGIGTSLTISRAAIDGTHEAVRVSGVRTVRAGDGVHAVDTDAVLEGVALSGNTRAGALFDLGAGASTRLSLIDVSVDAAGPALGAIVQNGTVEAGWDADVTRLGDAAANDLAFGGTLDVAGAVGPVCFPPLDELDTRGLDALLGP